MTDAAEIEEIATRWLLRRMEVDWSSDDQAEFDAWIEASVENKVAFWRLEAGWVSVGRMAALRAPALPVAANDRGPARSRWALAAVAAVAVLLSPAGWWATHKSALTGTYATPIGGREDIPLADGTQVELNTQTKLRTNLAGADRQAWLDRGEAYFEVAHDPKRPFIVHVGPKLVTVLGTRFLVRRDGDRVEVGVIEGRVRVENADRPVHRPAPAAILTRGDMIVGDGGSTMMAPRSISAVSDDLAWRDGLVNFDQATLADAAAEFNRYNERPLVIADDLAATRISGTFEARNVAVFAQLLHRTYGLNVEEDSSGIKIFR